MKIGIFGGAFDPPHLGHLILAEKIREEFNLDKIIFIPTNIPPHKEKPIASPNDRVLMLKFATEENPYFQISTTEIKRGGISYTIDTIKELKQMGELFLIIGADEAKQFDKWKNFNEILSLCKIIIVGRNRIKKDELPSILNKAFFIEFDVNISSTEIRERVKAGKSIKYLVPNEIEMYIKNKNLYK